MSSLFCMNINFFWFHEKKEKKKKKKNQLLKKETSKESSNKVCNKHESDSSNITKWFKLLIRFNKDMFVYDFFFLVQKRGQAQCLYINLFITYLIFIYYPFEINKNK